MLGLHFVTPAVGESPDPTPTAFWGFAPQSLIVGFIFAYPINCPTPKRPTPNISTLAAGPSERLPLISGVGRCRRSHFGFAR